MTSNSPSRPIRDLRFFLTVPHDCSYLPDREATTLFLDPKESPGVEVYESLTLLGFRRSGRHLYRPHCEGCNECKSVRIPVADFIPNRTQRKLVNRNADLETRIVRAHYSPEHYVLYSRYIHARHHDGDMYPPSPNQYRAFLNSNEPYAFLMEFRLHGELLAVSAFDRLSNGLSAIYTFFSTESDMERRSFGTYAVLTLIEQARQEGLDHIYLGYWIQHCRKMRYKQSFTPLEVLSGRQWRRLIL